MTPSEMKQQKDRALACFVMALAIAASVFLSVFGAGGKRVLDAAEKEIALHENLLRQSELDLQQNQAALSEAKGALAKLRQPAPR
jgi:hypothetical protein